jgi:hypothetical protein
MDLWILGLGALVLIAITVWIVWPARSADTVGSSVRLEEVQKSAMTENAPTGMPPQGGRFEDQYTSATADLSAGGVAVGGAPSTLTFTPSTQRDTSTHSVPTKDPVEQTRGQRWPEADASSAHIGPASRAENFPYEVAAQHDNGGMFGGKMFGLGAGSLLTIGSAIGGAFLYTRWQRERNKPLNRLRRGARGVASQVGDRLSDFDFDDLTVGRAPMGGAASALLLAALLGTRALRRDDSPELSSDSVSSALDRTRAESRRAIDRIPLDRLSLDRLPYDRLPDVSADRPTIFGLGAGGLALVAGSMFVVWRLLRRQAPQTPYNTWYAGE